MSWRIIHSRNLLLPVPVAPVPRAARDPSGATIAAPPRESELEPSEPIALPFEHQGGGRWSEIRDVDDLGRDEDEELRPPKRMEWGTIATIVLLVALSVAAVVSVVLRQQDAKPSVAPPSEPSVGAAPEPVPPAP